MSNHNPKKNKDHWILCSARTSLESLQRLLEHLIRNNYDGKEYNIIQKLLFQDIRKNSRLTAVKTLAGVRQNIKALEHINLISKYKGPHNREILKIDKIAKYFLNQPYEVFTNLFYGIEFSKNNYKSEVASDFNIKPGLFVLKLLYYLEIYYGYENSYLTSDDFSHYIIFVKNDSELVDVGNKIYRSHILKKYPTYSGKSSSVTYKNHGGWIKALLKQTAYIEEYPSQRGAIRLNYKTIKQDASDSKSINNKFAEEIIELFSHSDFKVNELQNKEDLKALRKIVKTSDINIRKLLDRFRKTTKAKKSRTGTRRYIPMSPLLKAAIKKAANFICQACGKLSFKDQYGLGYCEPHHIITRAKEGEIDNPDNIVVLCPLCHSKIHHGAGNVKREVYTELINKGYIKLLYFEKLAKEKRISFLQLEFLKKEGIISKKSFKQISMRLK